jgi:nitroimidazol reductase NimA-like FMN-containing flavoprotein (pyridoxamine 5'-phosphate oxidase superfamily)
MDESDGPADDVSLKTVLDAVNRQSKNTEAIVEAKERNQCQSNSFFKRLKLYLSLLVFGRIKHISN